MNYQFDQSHWMLFLDTFFDAALLVDAAGVIQYANNAACTLYGKQLSSLKGEVFGYSLASSMLEPVKLEIEKNKTVTVLIKASKIDLNGTCVWFVVLHDITEFYNIKNELSLRNNVFHSMRSGVIITDDKTRIVAVNTAFEKITGYTKKEILGLTPSILKSDRHKSEFYKTMWDTIIDTGFWSGEVWNKQKNGSLYPQLLTISAVKNESGNVGYYIATLFSQQEAEDLKISIENVLNNDALTGLLNSVCFEKQVSQYIASSSSSDKRLSVLSIEIENTDKIIQAYGDDIYNCLLIQVAEVLSQLSLGEVLSSRKTDHLFTVLLPLIDPYLEMQDFVKQFYQLCQSPILVKGHYIPVSFFIGASLLSENNRVSYEVLIHQSEQALVLAKQINERFFLLYDIHAHESSLVTQLKVEKMVSDALNAKKITFFYQPILDLESKRMISAEALLRIRDSKDYIPAGNFIHYVKSIQLLNDLTCWGVNNILNTFLSGCCSKHNFKISINTDPSLLSTPDFADKMIKILKRFDQALLKRLEFEVLESAVETNIAIVRDNMEKISALGVTFALDDFGRSHSNFEYLVSLPFSKVKIDKLFVRNIEHNMREREILLEMINVAKKVCGYALVEGVETIGQEKVLSDLGCDLVQGYYYSEPLELTVFESWLLNHEKIVNF